MDAQQRFRSLVIATLVAGYLLIILGGIVRVEGAGMGCGDDWPICNGEVVPTFDYLTALEYGHRVVAGTVMLLTGALVFAGWRMRAANRWYFRLPLLAFVLVIAQALLGAVTVFVELEPEIVTAHLGMAQSYLGLVLVLGLIAFRSRPAGQLIRYRPGRFGRYGAVAALAVFVLMLTGAYTATSPAAWACPEWPGCRGHYYPTGTTPLDIHLMHRWAALIAFVVVILALVQALRYRMDNRAIVILTAGATALMTAQVFIGAMNIWYKLASWVSVTHLGTATLVLGALIAAVMLDGLMPEPEPIAEERRQPGIQQPERAIVVNYATVMRFGVVCPAPADDPRQNARPRGRSAADRPAT